MRAFILLTALGLATAAPQPTAAQGSTMVISQSSSVGSVGSRALSHERVERMGEAMGFDDVQMSVALDLFREIADERQALADARRQAIERAREDAQGGDFSAFFAITKEQAAAYEDAVDALERRFITDMQALLLPEQQEAWPKAERIYRRGQLTGPLLRSEARVDVDELIREAYPQAYGRADVSEVLERWAVQVDGLLRERERKAEDIGGGADFRGGFVVREDTFGPLRELDARIASTGHQAVRTLSSLLEDEGVERAWLRSAFARVFRQTDGERRLAAALELDDLTEDQREQLRAAADQHEREVSAARDRWVKAERMREEENTLPPGMVVMIQGEEPSASELAKKAVEALDDRLEGRLAAILSPEQLALLPEATPEPVERVMPGVRGSHSIRIGG